MKRVLWVSYDALNSLLIIIGAVYFTKWLIADAGVSDTIVALATSSATILFVIIGPRFGAAMTTESRTYRQLLLMTILVCGLGIALGAPGLQRSPTAPMVIGVVIVFFALNLVYQLSLVAYNCYLTVLVPPTLIQRYSGIGEGAGQFGSLIGLVLAVALLSSDPAGWFRASPVRLFLVVGPLVFVASLAVVLGMRNANAALRQAPSTAADTRVLHWLFGREARQSGFSTLILVIFLYNNAFATLQVFASSYLAFVAHWDETRIGVGIITTFVGAGFGGLLSAAIRRRIALEKQLLIGAFVFALSVTGLSIASTAWQFTAALFFTGMGFGYLAAVSRSCIVLFRGTSPIGVRFGLYGAASRTAAIVGPLLWAGLIAISAPLGEDTSRRVALAGLSVLTWAACALLIWTKLRMPSADESAPTGSATE